MPSDASSDETALPFVRLVLAANDRDHVLWPSESTQFAQRILIKTRGGVTTIEAVVAALGKERFQALLSTIVEKRQFDNACLGHQSPCHYCSGPEDLKAFDFALMRVVQTSRKWGETAASLALSAALVPLVGGGMVRFPGKSSSGQAIHLRLIVCATCRKKEGNVFGAFVVNAKKAAKHPLCERIVAAGFTTFLVRETMPAEFKRGLAHTRL